MVTIRQGVTERGLDTRLHPAGNHSQEATVFFIKLLTLAPQLPCAVCQNKGTKRTLNPWCRPTAFAVGDSADFKPLKRKDGLLHSKEYEKVHFALLPRSWLCLGFFHCSNSCRLWGASESKVKTHSRESQ